MANEWHDTIKYPPEEVKRVYIFIAEIEDGELMSYRFGEGFLLMGEWREDGVYEIDPCFTVTHWMKPEVPDIFKKETRKWTKTNT